MLNIFYAKLYSFFVLVSSEDDLVMIVTSLYYLSANSPAECMLSFDDCLPGYAPSSLRASSEDEELLEGRFLLLELP